MVAAVAERGRHEPRGAARAVAEVAISYTGDLTDPAETLYTLGGAHGVDGGAHRFDAGQRPLDGSGA